MINNRRTVRKVWLWVSLAIAFNIFIGCCHILSAILWRAEVHNEYMPVRVTSTRPPIIGGIYGDGKSAAFFTIKNYTNKEQKVSFLVYQHNNSTGEDQLFNIEHVYFFLGVDKEEEIENGVVKIPGGQSRHIHIEAKAKDSTKVLTSRGAPNVEIVILDN